MSKVIKTVRTGGGCKLTALLAFAMAVMFIAALDSYAATGTNWYVDANNGDDGYDGRSASRGEGLAGPKKTLAAVLSGVKSYDKVYAAPGFYSNGTMMVDGAPYRAYVTNIVSLIATSSAADTFIVGGQSTDESRDQYGNGPGAVRGVYLCKYASLRGFTVTGGRTPLDKNYLGAAAGICGDKLSTVQDCVISNNVAAYRGGGVSGVPSPSGVAKGPSVYRCWFENNIAADTGVAHSAWNLTTADNCIFKDSLDFGYHAYQCTSLRNCTFVGTCGFARTSTAYNCLVLQNDGGQMTMYNCFYTKLSNTSTADDACKKITSAEAMLDDDLRPLKNSVAVDAGDSSYYTATDRLDFSGLQRVYNGKIDVGALEYNWLGDFGGMLNGKGYATVAAASESVTTNTTTGLVMVDGDSLCIDYRLKRNAPCHFRVTSADGGSVSVTHEGAALLPDATGLYTYNGQGGANRVEIVYSGAGDGIVSEFFHDPAGFAMTIR